MSCALSGCGSGAGRSVQSLWAAEGHNFGRQKGGLGQMDKKNKEHFETKFVT